MAKIIYNVKDYRSYGIDEIMIEGCMGCYHSTAKTVAEACEEYYSLYQQRVEKEKKDALRMEMRDREAEARRNEWLAGEEKPNYRDEQKEAYGGYKSVEEQVMELAYKYRNDVIVGRSKAGVGYRVQLDYTDSGEGGIAYIFVSPHDNEVFYKFWDFTDGTFERPDFGYISDWFADAIKQKTTWEYGWKYRAIKKFEKEREEYSW